MKSRSSGIAVRENLHKQGIPVPSKGEYRPDRIVRILLFMSAAVLPPAVADHPMLVPCVLHSAQDNLYEAGKIVGLSMHHCHVESQADVTPGMALSVFVILPDTRRVLVLEEALVTWVRTEEFGLRLNALRSDDAAQLETHLAASLTKRRTRTVGA